MKTLLIEKPAGFSLEAASQFYAGFTPGTGMAAAALDQLTLAFRVERSFGAAVVALRERGDVLVAELTGSDDEQGVRRQLSRMLGLEAVAESWIALGRRVPLVGTLQREFPGFFTATKASPYDAAVWSIIAPRTHIEHAARIKMAIAREHGSEVELHGRVHNVFPEPRVLLELSRADGLNAEKVARLRAVASAALDGLLDTEYLRALPEWEALARLQTIRGVGPWSAGHIYYRGAAPIDALPAVEPRVLHGFAHASGASLPTAQAFQRAAEAWRPFRMWVSVLLSRHLARTSGWRAPALGEQRAAAGVEARGSSARERSVPAQDTVGGHLALVPGLTGWRRDLLGFAPWSPRALLVARSRWPRRARVPPPAAHGTPCCFRPR
jgi:DNA-3-methyladenine glycosylase II